MNSSTEPDAGQTASEQAVLRELQRKAELGLLTPAEMAREISRLQARRNLMKKLTGGGSSPTTARRGNPPSTE